MRVGASLARGVRELRLQPVQSEPRWGYVVLSGAVFLIAHGVLVATWRTVLSCWDEHLPFWSAARVWSVSNLGRYVPGKIWQIGAMGAMARELNVSPLAASGSALLGTLVNIAAGCVVALVSGQALLLVRVAPAMRMIATATVVAAAVSLLTLPFLLPRLAPVVGRIVGKPLQATVPVRAVVYSLVGNALAWLVYGLAFEIFVKGIFGHAIGGYPTYLAVYTSSYLIGYLFLFAPAGVGFRETAMLQLLQTAGLATHPQAALVTLASRIWLTLLEVVPALFFWMHHRMHQRVTTIDRSDAPS